MARRRACVALSRRKQGFDSPWGRQALFFQHNRHTVTIQGFQGFIRKPTVTVKVTAPLHSAELNPLDATRKRTGGFVDLLRARGRFRAQNHVAVCPIQLRHLPIGLYLLLLRNASTSCQVFRSGKWPSACSSFFYRAFTGIPGNRRVEVAEADPGDYHVIRDRT